MNIQKYVKYFKVYNKRSTTDYFSIFSWKLLYSNKERFSDICWSILHLTEKVRNENIKKLVIFIMYAIIMFLAYLLVLQGNPTISETVHNGSRKTEWEIE